MSEDLLIKIGADISEATAKMDEVGKKGSGLGEILNASTLSAAAAFTGLIAGINESINAFTAADTTSRQLSAALQDQGLFTVELKEKYVQYADVIAEQTGLSKNSLLQAEIVAQQQIGQIPVTQQLTKAIADLAVAQGISLTEAAKTVGQAIKLGTGELTRHGLQLSATSTETERYAATIEFLNGKYGDASTAISPVTLATGRLKNSFEETAVTIGASLAPAYVGLVNLLTEVSNVSKIVYERMVQVATGIVAGYVQIFGGIAKILGVFKGDFSQFGQGVKDIGSSIATSWKVSMAEIPKATEAGLQQQDATKAAFAAKETARQNQRDADARASAAARRAYIKAEDEGASAEVLKIKKEEVSTLQAIQSKRNSDEEAELHAHLAKLRQEEAQALAEDKAQKAAYNKAVAGEDKAFQARVSGQNSEFSKKEQADQRKQFETQKDAQKKVDSDKIKEQAKSNNLFLEEQIKYGTAYATIDQAMHSAVFQGSKQAFGDLAQLQQSSNSTLKAIGKVATIANIVIKTAESAMNIYAGFSTIPIVGPALGIAGAAAAIAFGAEQVQKASAAATGGVVQGQGYGDTQPYMLEPGELIAPRQNFDEVVSSVAKSRGMTEGGQQNQEAGFATVQLQFKGDIMDYIEAKLVQRKYLNIGIYGSKA